MSEVFHFRDDEENFETHACENGFTYWSALKLMNFLGYTNWATFNQVINKAMITCNTLNIPIVNNFEQVIINVNGKDGVDFKLSRFACYLIAMNGSVKLPNVAQAQVYFATIAGAVQDYQLEAEKVERLQVRSEISEREATLNSVANRAGVENYAFFQNAGYRGMYNKNMGQLKKLRNIDSNKSLLDFMGKDELAANLFRITQTELKIKNEKVTGQARLENAAETVGKEVRNTMIKISKIAPEKLPKHEDIKDVKKGLKETNKRLKTLDQPKTVKNKKSK
ncbi:MAG: damage-inducible protein D [Bacteroidetes bacterium 43-16]|nr:MAG: damage-inducible protein D [Bacteroidetes bacterium 43-16]